MNFSFGVYEIFSYSLPGGLQLLVIGYLLDRFEWLDHNEILALPTGALIVGGLAASLLAGNVIYPPALFLARGPNDAITNKEKADFAYWHPKQKDRPFLDAGFQALQGAINMNKPEARSEIDSLAAQGLMLRNAVVPLAIAALVALGEVVLSNERSFAAFACVGFTVAALLARRGGLRYFKWQVRATLHHAVWVEDIDRLGREGRPLPASPGGGRASLLSRLLSNAPAAHLSAQKQEAPGG